MTFCHSRASLFYGRNLGAALRFPPRWMTKVATPLVSSSPKAKQKVKRKKWIIFLRSRNLLGFGTKNITHCRFRSTFLAFPFSYSRPFLIGLNTRSILPVGWRKPSFPRKFVGSSIFESKCFLYQAVLFRKSFINQPCPLLRNWMTKLTPNPSACRNLKRTFLPGTWRSYMLESFANTVFVGVSLKGVLFIASRASFISR